MERTRATPMYLPVTNPVRGLLHGTAALAALLAVPTLWNATDLPARRTALVAYGAMLAAMFAVSALYHSVPWSPPWKRRWRRLDHTMISMFIAAAVTAYAVFLLHGGLLVLVLVLQWGLAALVALLKHTERSVRLGRSVTIQLVQGWTALPAAGPAAAALPAATLALAAGGGLLYTVGAVLLLTKRPRLWPGVFSYHELFHVLVIVASAAHFAVIAGALPTI